MNPSEVLNNPYFIRYRKALIFIGIWPYQGKIYKICVRIFIIFAIYSMTIPQQIRTAFEIQKEVRDINVLYENCTGFMYLQGCLTKYLAYIIYMDKLKTIYEEITADYEEIKEEKELSELHRNASIGGRLSTYYFGFGYLGGCFFCSLNIVIPVMLNIFFPKNESRPIALCYYAEYFIDQKEYFSLLYIHTLICVYCTVFIWTVADSTYVNCVLHVIGLFKIIQYRMTAIGEKFDVNVNKNSNESATELQKHIVNSIKLYNKSIKFAELINKSYDKCFFYTFTMFICGFGILMVDLVKSFDNIPNLLRLAIGAFGVVINLFYLTWPGQSLLDANEDLRNAVYFSEWYKMPRKAKLLLYFMMLRCTKPCRMTAGPLIDLNMENCGMILRAGVSYFTFALSFS